MSFPQTPTNGQLYSNPIGTQFQYDSTRHAWNIVSQAVTGVTGVQGPTGIQGLGQTGIQGMQGDTGLQGFGSPQYNAGSLTGASKQISWFNGIKQKLSIGSTGMVYMTDGTQGSNSQLVMDYLGNYVAGITGVQIPGGGSIILTGQTGIHDVVSVYFDGTNFMGQGALNFKW